MKTPIALNIDDASARISVYYEHHFPKTTRSGEPLLPLVPNAMMSDFCSAVSSFGIRGKFSVVPMPGGLGRLDGELTGVPRKEIDEWLSLLHQFLDGNFDFCPELLTHKGAVDLVTGQMTEEREDAWSYRQSAETLTDYISYALRILKNAGIRPTGVTSPWDFGIRNEDAYALAVSRAYERVFGDRDAWYFCRSLYGEPPARPWLAATEDGRRVVSIPGSVRDRFWQTIDTTDASEEYIRSIADCYLTDDGRSGEILDILATGGFPILTAHWQSLFSNGRKTGLRALKLVAERVGRHLSDRVEWTNYSDLMRMTLDGKSRTE